MADTPKIEAWVRGRFVVIPGATADRIRANAWTVRIPKTQEVSRTLRLRSLSMRSLDDLVLALDEEEAEQVMVSRETSGAFELSVLL